MVPSVDPLDFFKEKRPWSRQKDRILREYIPPYLQILSRAVKQPILLVDGFAGPGRFKSGEVGSPVILAESIENSGVTPTPRLLVVERNPILAAALNDEMKKFDFAEFKQSEFVDAVPRIRELAKGRTTFLYLDPCAIAGLDWAAITSILNLVRERQSIELLLNFNAHAFVRRARAALALETADLEDVDDEDYEEWQGQGANAARLDAAVGGNWWRPLVSDDNDRIHQAGSIVLELTKRLRDTLKEVCFFEVYGGWKHKVPKYFLVFASRSRVALTLMNDAMCKGHNEFLAQAAKTDLPLFEPTATVALRHKPEGLDDLILDQARNRIMRKDLIVRVIERLSREQRLGLISSSEIRKRVTELRKRGQLQSSPPSGQMNPKTLVWAIVDTE